MDVVSRNCSIVYCFAGRLAGAAADFVAGACAETRAVKSATIDAIHFMAAPPDAGIIASSRRDERPWLEVDAYRRDEPGGGWMIALASAPLNSVISPALLPGAGSNLAASGLFHLNASVATSPTMLAIAASLVS